MLDLPQYSCGRNRRFVVQQALNGNRGIRLVFGEPASSGNAAQALGGLQKRCFFFSGGRVLRS
jgi:hypothetical protein